MAVRSASAHIFSKTSILCHSLPDRLMQKCDELALLDRGLWFEAGMNRSLIVAAERWTLAHCLRRIPSWIDEEVQRRVA